MAKKVIATKHLLAKADSAPLMTHSDSTGAALAPSAGTAPALAASAAATHGPVQRVVVSMSVNFVVTTTDGLRQVNFGLEKDTQGTDVEWQIHFKLLERSQKTDPFDIIVSLDVDVKTSLIPQAETMAHGKPTPEQAAHIVGPLADDSKLVATKDLPKHTFDEEVQQTLG
jgi:hypothetical protein